ncbi:hypothetical protein BS50DRAFT_78248 [Corynespora cassiicola Philippines]|uniref:Uncharacterized protein n=1 Tax=Corynespora cassiicola Philippines TaxID=1448308 RepID=A0A2T2NGQ4_CORCC|nr:hypothetical protein BS50DRAFT_78248 [Corynespora cassiicola Philippines]
MGFHIRKFRVKYHPEDIHTLISKETVLDIPPSGVSPSPYSPGTASQCHSPSSYAPPIPAAIHHHDTSSPRSHHDDLTPTSPTSSSSCASPMDPYYQYINTTPQFLGFNSTTLSRSLSLVTKLYMDNKGDVSTLDLRPLELPYAEARAFHYVQRLADTTPSLRPDPEFEARVRDVYGSERAFADLAVRHFIRRVGTWNDVVAEQRKSLRRTSKRRSWISMRSLSERSDDSISSSSSATSFGEERSVYRGRWSELGRLLKDEKRRSTVSEGRGSGSSEIGRMLKDEKVVYGAGVSEELERATTLEGLAQLVLEVKRLDAGIARLPNDVALLRRKSRKTGSWE